MERKTKQEVVDFLNSRHVFKGDKILFEPVALGHAIAVITEATGLIEKNELPKLSNLFHEILKEQLALLGITSEVQWNNTGNVFWSFIDSNTSAWDK